jgi:hypothetical protein
MADVKTNNFMLSSGTLMISPFAQGALNTAFDLDAANSVGLIKNLSTKEESSQIELRNGVRQLLADSQKSGVQVTLGAEVYEYTAQNLLYSLSLNRTATVIKASRLGGPAAAAAATLNLSGTAASASYQPLAVGDLTAGTVLLIKGSGDFAGRMFITRVQTTATALTAVSISPALPAGMSFAINDGVYLVNQIPIGTTATQDFFSVKIVGTLANEDKPLVQIFPKVKITKGFNLDLTEDKYGSMNWEIQPYFMSTADIGADARLGLIGVQNLAYSFIGV